MNAATQFNQQLSGFTAPQLPTPQNPRSKLYKGARIATAKGLMNDNPVTIQPSTKDVREALRKGVPVPAPQEFFRHSGAIQKMSGLTRKESIVIGLLPEPPTLLDQIKAEAHRAALTKSVMKTDAPAKPAKKGFLSRLRKAFGGEA